MDAQALAKVQENHTKILRDILLGAIKANREIHKSDYDKAIVGWRGECVKALKKHQQHIDKVIARMEADIVEGKPVRGLEARNISPKIPARPEDHTADYDGLIRRLEMSADETIWLTHRDFERFVLDRWDWKEVFTAQISSYFSPELSSDFLNYDD